MAEDEKRGIQRTWGEIVGDVMPALAPVPEPFPELDPIRDAYHQLGRDQNGAPLYSERAAWLRENEVADDGVRAAIQRFWEALEGERQAVVKERIDEMSNR